MDERQSPSDLFEHERAHLRAVAYRMLGSAAEAEDALQEAWLRVSRAGLDGVSNPRRWLTAVVARVCVDMRQLADSLGVALLVVLETLAPAERVAFVLHDIRAHRGRGERAGVVEIEVLAAPTSLERLDLALEQNA